MINLVRFRTPRSHKVNKTIFAVANLTQKLLKAFEMQQQETLVMTMQNDSSCNRF